MKVAGWMSIVSMGAMLSASAMAQAPAGAPAGANGMCKDGTYSMSAKKEGACRGHKGVQSWFTATSATNPMAAAPAPTPMTPAAKAAVAPSRPMAAAPAPTPAPMQAAPAPTPTTVQSSSTAAKRMSPTAAAAARTQAPGGGPGMVWVNTSSKVYHCPGSDFYGKTKEGSYMSEADAKAKGDRPDHNKVCTK